MKRFKCSRGVTMIELIATVGILGVGLVAILALFPAGIRFSRNTSNLSQATMLGQEMIERIRLDVVQGRNYGWITSPANYGSYALNSSNNNQPFLSDDRFECTIDFRPQPQAYVVDNNSSSGQITGLRKVTVEVRYPRVIENNATLRQAGWQKQRVRRFVTYIYVP